MKIKSSAVISIILALILTQGAFATEITVVPSKNMLSVQKGDTVEIADTVPAYIYHDNNYFMLRDVGRIVGYRITWNEDAKHISMIKDNNVHDFNALSTVDTAKNVN